MKVTALRGVCVGVGKNVTRGQILEVEDSEDLRWLIEIGALAIGEIELPPLAGQAPAETGR